MKFILILLFFSLVPSAIIAQSNCNSKIIEDVFDDVLNSIDHRDYDRAIANSLRIIEDAENNDCYKNLYDAYNLLSTSYVELRDTIPAQLYAKKALSYAELSQNDTLLTDAYNNLATFYTYDEKDYDKAMILYKKSLTIARIINDDRFLNAALNIAELHKKMGDYEAMPKYLKEAEKSLNKENIKFDDPRIYIDIQWGDYYYHKNQKQRSLGYFANAFKRVEKDSLRLLGIDFYERYASRLAELNEYSKAYEVEKRLLAYELEATRIESDESLLKAKAQANIEEYKRNQKEAKLQETIVEQNLQRRNTEGILIGILLILFVIFLIYFLQSTKSRKALILNLRKNNIALKKAKDDAEKSSDAKERFFSTLSHEMRTPLYGVTGIVSLLEKSPNFHQNKDELSSLKFSATHLLDIINDLLDISKLENDNFELYDRPFNLRNLIKEIVNSLSQYATDQKNLIHVNLSPSVPNYLIGDSRRLSQIVLNILSNSMKFTKNGDIWINIESTKEKDGPFSISFSINDNGVGIDKKEQAIIFDEFSQIDNKANDPEYLGTGLGLPIVKKILEKMNSTIHLESEKNEGTHFNFTIKFEEATLLDVIDFSSSKRSKSKIDKSFQIQGMTFLIVDDNKINRMVTSKLLIERGAKTEEAASGEEAIELIKDKTYDLILMDINMPGINGFETSKTMRKLNVKVPIVALTAADASYIEKMIKTYGMNGAIIKPYSMEEFMKVITEHLPSSTKTISI
ncbi:MAG: response regulator [Leeuwenhoekiella sp.]